MTWVRANLEVIEEDGTSFLDSIQMIKKLELVKKSMSFQ